MKVAILIPAFNVPPWDDHFVTRMGDACDELCKVHNLEVYLIYVDDGSTSPGTQLEYHAPVLRRLNCHIVQVRHCINRGQGAALQTAIELARSDLIKADYFVTFDADGQHDPADIPRLISALGEKDLNIVFGNRFNQEMLEGSGIPLSRFCLLRLARFFDRWLTGLKLQDAHNGLRAFDLKTAEIMNLTSDRMAHATEIKIHIARSNMRYGEIPVRITYSKDTLKGGQRNVDALRVFMDLVESWWFQ